MYSLIFPVQSLGYAGDYSHNKRPWPDQSLTLWTTSPPVLDPRLKIGSLRGVIVQSLNEPLKILSVTTLNDCGPNSRPRISRRFPVPWRDVTDLTRILFPSLPCTSSCSIPRQSNLCKTPSVNSWNTSRTLPCYSGHPGLKRWLSLKWNHGSCWIHVSSNGPTVTGEGRSEESVHIEEVQAIREGK